MSTHRSRIWLSDTLVHSRTHRRGTSPTIWFMSSDRSGDSKYRVGVAFFYHESHSFSTLRTDIESFRQEALGYGDEIIAIVSLPLN